MNTLYKLILTEIYSDKEITRLTANIDRYQFEEQVLNKILSPNIVDKNPCPIHWAKFVLKHHYGLGD